MKSRIRHDDNNKNHWQMTRYYERNDHGRHEQRLKHRLEKILLIIVVVFAVGANIGYFVIRINSNILLINATEYIGGNEVVILNDTYAYIQLADVFASQLLLSVFLLFNIVVMLLKKTRVPIHTVVKLLLFYNVMKPTVILFKQLDVAEVSRKLSLPNDYFMWALAVIPFSGFLPLIPFILSRSPYDHIQTILGLLRSYLELLSNLLKNRDKVYRLLNTISTILGTCAFIMIVMSMAVPWTVVKFRPKEDLRPTINSTRKFISTLKDTLNVFEKITQTVCQSTYKDFQNELAEVKNNSLHHDPSLMSIFSKLSGEETDCEAVEIAEKISCGIYLASYPLAISLMIAPFTGFFGKLLLSSARVSRRVFILLQQFKQVQGKIKDTINSLNFVLGTILKDPIYEWVVAFKPELYMIVIILPCMVLGLYSISLGFWKRDRSIVEVRLIVTMVSTVFLFTNVVMCIFVWTFKTAVEVIFEELPLVTAEVHDLIGWRLVKLAYILSSISSLILMIYQFGKIIIYIHTYIA